VDNFIHFSKKFEKVFFYFLSTNYQLLITFFLALSKKATKKKRKPSLKYCIALILYFTKVTKVFKIT